MSASIATDINLNKLPEHVLKALNERIGQAVNDGITPAVSLAVFHYDSPILNVSWGWLDPDTRQLPTQTSTLFDLASLTKLYTSFAFFALVSDKQAYLHSPVVNIIPEFGDGGMRAIDGGQDPHTKERLPVDEALVGQQVDPTLIDCFHLLTHTSSLPAWRDVYTIAEVPVEPPQQDPLPREQRWQRALKRLTSYPFTNHPESGVRYSDIGLMLLGEIVARQHGTPGNLEQAIQERVLGDRFPATVFNPLYHDYTRERIAPTEYDATWRKRRIWGEVHDENASGVGGVAGHAGLFAPAFEVGLLGNMWLNHAERLLKVDPELAGAAVELQAQTDNEVRGLGWMLKSPTGSSASDRFSPQSYGHTGFTGTSLWIDPRENLVVALLTNRVYGGRELVGIHDLRRAVHTLIANFVQT
ncbi:MAG: serine hydrolase domain-containing protein [Anaerolineae bacterium]